MTNPAAAQAAGLSVIGAAQAQVVLAGGISSPLPASGVFAVWVGLNGFAPFGQDILPQINLYGDGSTFNLNLTDYTLFPFILTLDDHNPSVNSFKVNGVLADASDNPYA